MNRFGFGGASIKPKAVHSISDLSGLDGERLPCTHHGDVWCPLGSKSSSLPRFGQIAEHGVAESGGDLGLHAGHDVLVDGHGEGDVAVA